MISLPRRLKLMATVRGDSYFSSRTGEWVARLWASMDFFYMFKTFQYFFSYAVFKCKYFWSYSRKTHFLTIYIHISKGLNSLKHCSIGQIFFYRFRTFELSFIFVICVLFKCQYFWSYSRKTHFDY